MPQAEWQTLKSAAGIAILAALAGAIGGAALARRKLLKRWLSRQPAPSHLTRLDAHLAVTASADVPPSNAAVLRRDVARSVERMEAARDLAVIDVILADIRDLAGADEVVYWAWSEAREVLVPGAWSTEGATCPQFFDVRSWAPLVRWSAEERLVHFSGDATDAPVLAAGPVAGTGRLYGAITLSAAKGLGISRESARRWLPRFSAQLASLLELFDVRREYGRQMRQNEMLLDAAQRLHGLHSAEALANAICDSVREVTSATVAGLVRWNAADDCGVLQSSSTTLELEPGFHVTSETLVGRACRDRVSLVLEDARPATSDSCPYGGPPRPIGSLVIVPIKNDRHTIGAVVLEGIEPGDVAQHESRSIGLLAAVVRGPLESVWEIEEVSRRARTDPLTGLANRRHFEEQLRRVLAETDRFGGCCSLIVLDIDHFKQVNDRYGHEGGDAVLRHVAQLMGDAIRTVDVCTRYGGEEIAVLLPQTTGEAALEVAERLRLTLAERPASHAHKALPITASFGVASYPSPVPYGDWLFPAADKALYDAKAAGRNCVRMISPSHVTADLYRGH
jgi:diguanylate cyclase (GGDEF)-like protein